MVVGLVLIVAGIALVAIDKVLGGRLPKAHPLRRATIFRQPRSADEYQRQARIAIFVIGVAGLLSLGALVLASEGAGRWRTALVGPLCSWPSNPAWLG